jgi:hypothetical protein
MIRAQGRIVLSRLGQAQASESPLLDLRIFCHAFEGRPVLRSTVQVTYTLHTTCGICKPDTSLFFLDSEAWRGSKNFRQAWHQLDALLLTVSKFSQDSTAPSRKYGLGENSKEPGCNLLGNNRQAKLASGRETLGHILSPDELSS